MLAPSLFNVNTFDSLYRRVYVLVENLVEQQTMEILQLCLLSQLFVLQPLQSLIHIQLETGSIAVDWYMAAQNIILIVTHKCTQPKQLFCAVYSSSSRSCK